MTTLNIELSDDLKARIQARAAQRGFDRIEAYVEALLQQEADEELDDQDLEELLLGRLNDARTTELTPSFIEEFNRDAEARRRARRATP